MTIDLKDDIVLWNAVRHDDENAFKELFDRYWGRLYNTCNRYLKNRETSEELVHDIFLNLWDRRRNLEIICFENYLLNAVRYQAYNRIRAKKLAVTYIDESQFHDAADASLADDRINEQELEQEVFAYMHQLPKRCQEIFRLSRFNNLSNDEIAAQLGISKRSVENQITIALKHLRLCLKHTASLTVLFMLMK
ncbi:RNA polymerase sigma-70 factor [Mucilaginibacter conchicola]|uniref:RNA polymerase sigma-70 factor n=1 Tax=Mucilaginibacter conchicola TaxID=2303333 RepID=A0A372NMC2_9SPHI|nr:RNA polymerase sigma-70 factor [Mucilaginibacter conchicola]RFZ89998.1 RNA polymerase sigma-70 factor [Mucilaginibacter conchicola]